MDKIPEQFKKIAQSAELYDQSEKVGEKFGLHIDQIGELDAEIRGVLLGVFDPADFGKHLRERLEIDEVLVKQITEAVNEEVFKAIRDGLKVQTSSISDLEKIGNFTIEEPRKEGAEEKTESLKTMSDETVTTTHREALLDALENPQPQPQPIQPTKNDVHTEPLVDLLMTKPTSIPEEKVVKTAPSSVPTTPPKVEPVKKVAPGPDPYREPIE